MGVFVSNNRHTNAPHVPPLQYFYWTLKLKEYHANIVACETFQYDALNMYKAFLLKWSCYLPLTTRVRRQFGWSVFYYLRSTSHYGYLIMHTGVFRKTTMSWMIIISQADAYAHQLNVASKVKYHLSLDGPYLMFKWSRLINSLPLSKHCIEVCTWSLPL